MKPTKKKDNSPFVAYQKPRLEFPLKLREFPWSEKQQEFIRIMQDRSTSVMFLQGPAGTAKSLLSVYCALNSMDTGGAREIFYVRQPVESSKFGLGFLKGDLQEKLTPFLLPLQDKLHELLSEGEIKKLDEGKRIVGVPIGHLRGRTFTNSYIIVDECQNLTAQDILLVMTRMGKFSKLILTGDIMQPDIKSNAFQQVGTLFDDEESKRRGIRTFNFGKEDIFRNEILAYVIEKFEKADFS